MQPDKPLVVFQVGATRRQPFLRALVQRIRKSLSRKVSTMSTATAAVVNTARPSPAQQESELRARLTALEAQLNDLDNVGDLAAQIHERDTIAQQLKVMAARNAVAQDAAYRARLANRRATFLSDLAGPLDWLRENLPRMRYELMMLQEMQDRIEEEGTGMSFEEMTGGWRWGGASEINNKIADVVRGTPLDSMHTPPALAKMLPEGSLGEQQYTLQKLGRQILRPFGPKEAARMLDALSAKD